jgi:hypothetical protein
MDFYFLQSVQLNFTIGLIIITSKNISFFLDFFRDFRITCSIVKMFIIIRYITNNSINIGIINNITEKVSLENQLSVADDNLKNKLIPRTYAISNQ